MLCLRHSSSFLINAPYLLLIRVLIPPLSKVIRLVKTLDTSGDGKMQLSEIKVLFR